MKNIYYLYERNKNILNGQMNVKRISFSPLQNNSILFSVYLSKNSK